MTSVAALLHCCRHTKATHNKNEKRGRLPPALFSWIKRWLRRQSRQPSRSSRVSPDPLDRPRITRSKSDGLRPHSIGRTSRRTPRVHGRTRPLFIGQTSLALPRVNRTDSHSESPRPLSHGRISPALGRPTAIQPFPNPDMDGINRHATTSQPYFGSNTRTTRFRLNLPTSLIRQTKPLSNNNSTSTTPRPLPNHYSTTRKARQNCRAATVPLPLRQRGRKLLILFSSALHHICAKAEHGRNFRRWRRASCAYRPQVL